MSDKNSKTSFLASITNLFLGYPCVSGLPHHSTRNFSIFTPDIYCMHPECVAVRYEHNFATIELDGIEIKGSKDTINKIKANQRTLGKLIEAKKILEENNKSAFEKGRQHGTNMERKKLFDTLLQSRQLLLDTMVSVGINEHRVAKFVEWYETQRDPRVNPKQDEITYKVCKNIMDLEITLREAMQTNVQLT